MIDMRIGEYHITSEPRNYIVSLAKLNDDGTPATTDTKSGTILNERVLGYYNSLPLALQSIAKVMLKGGSEVVENIEQYVDKAKEIDKTLSHAAQKYGQELEKLS